MPRILLPFAGVRDNGFQVIIEFRRVLFAHCPHLIHNLVLHHELILPSTPWSANDRGRKTPLLADFFDSGEHFGVRDMRAIPGQQKMHPMDRSHGDMSRVRDRFLWQREGKL